MKLLQSNKGETLLEVVLSVGMFAITMLLMASMFLGAMRTSSVHHETEKLTESLLNAAVKKESTTSAGSVHASFELSFSAGAGKTVTKEITLLKTQLPDTGAVYQLVGED